MKKRASACFWHVLTLYSISASSDFGHFFGVAPQHNATRHGSSATGVRILGELVSLVTHYKYLLYHFLQVQDRRRDGIFKNNVCECMGREAGKNGQIFATLQSPVRRWTTAHRGIIPSGQRYLGCSAIRTFHKTGRMATMKRYVAQYNSWQCEQRAFKLRDVLTCPHCICRMCV